MLEGLFMHGYDCVADYYDNYLFGRTPADVRRAREVEDRKIRENQEKISRELYEYRERYGD